MVQKCPSPSFQGGRHTRTRLRQLIIVVGSALFVHSIATVHLSHRTVVPGTACQPEPTTAADPALSFLCDDPAISFLQVLDPPPISVRPKVLCIVLTHGKNHETRLQTILDTWGQKCHQFIAASDLDEPLRKAIKVNATSGYWSIWDKLMKTLQLVVQNDSTPPPQQQQQHQQSFDWILKADDDTYVIMENLLSFLYNITNEDTHNQPLVYGRTMPWPKLKVFKDQFKGWFHEEHNKGFGERFYQKFSPKETLVYPHGGPGYIMNYKYASTLVNAYFHSDDVVKGRVSEDLANAVTMLYRDIRPHSTIDTFTGRERSHPESPRTMYDNPNWLPFMQENIQHRGDGVECCSPSSISYHHVCDREMRLLHYQLYSCPKRRTGEFGLARHQKLGT